MRALLLVRRGILVRCKLLAATFTRTTTPVEVDSPVTVSGFYGGPNVQSVFMTVTPTP